MGPYDKRDAAEDTRSTERDVAEAWHQARNDYQDDPRYEDDHGNWSRDRAEKEDVWDKRQSRWEDDY